MSALRRARATGLAAGLLGLLLAGCAARGVETPWEPLPDPPAAAVDHVLFLVGDAGEAKPGQSPLLARLTLEVEAWAGRLGRDSTVSVAYLGDIVYPNGVHDRSHPDFPSDSLTVLAQALVVGGPHGRRTGARGVFMAGNHDWAQEPADEGLPEVRNLGALLDLFRIEKGLAVDLYPDAGLAGPAVLDLGSTLRLAAVDTHFWLQADDDDPRIAPVVAGVAEAIETSGRRRVVFAAHHPFLTGGAHAGPMPIWKGFGLMYLLRQTGALMQDLNSRPYRGLTGALRDAFREVGQPFMWAGGHDHSLQVIAGDSVGEPRWNVVSGSGSKLTGVSPIPRMAWGRGLPGWVELTFLRDGAVDLRVFAAPERYQACDARDGSVEACMREGVPAYEVVYARRLAEARPAPPAEETGR